MINDSLLPTRSKQVAARITVSGDKWGRCAVRHSHTREGPLPVDGRRSNKDEPTTITAMLHTIRQLCFQNTRCCYGGGGNFLALSPCLV